MAFLSQCSKRRNPHFVALLCRNLTVQPYDVVYCIVFAGKVLIASFQETISGG